jgi:hypothetical protein
LDRGVGVQDVDGTEGADGLGDHPVVVLGDRDVGD